MEIKAIVTMPPYAPYLKDVVRHRIVSGIRLNTVMPVKDPLDTVLSRLNDKIGKYGKDLWVDLKYRQLRVRNFGVPPFTEIELSHEIEVDVPCLAYFSDGKESATVIEVDGNRLIMQDGPKRVVGPGESVNLPYSSLKIKGGLTETDIGYLTAGRRTGVHNYMLSYVENKDDLQEVYNIDPDATIIEKIESKKGLEYVKNGWDGKTRLMAARGDLFIEVGQPHEIVCAVEDIVKKDSNAIVASRIFDSFSYSLEPTCEDIGDVDNLMRMGYRTLMLGDNVCLRYKSLLSALNLMEAMATKYNGVIR
jgi:hypothetical protein